jgi:hypothetical protein
MNSNNSYQLGFQYNAYQPPPTQSTIPPVMMQQQNTMGPPAPMQQQNHHQTLHYQSSDGEISFNDSGYYSSTTPSSHSHSFTSLSAQPRSAVLAQQNMANIQNQQCVNTNFLQMSPSKFFSFGQQNKPASLQQQQQNTAYTQSPARVQTLGVGGDGLDVPALTDDWEGNFLNSFQENLFDSADLNTIVDSLLTSPPSSPFKSPHGGGFNHATGSVQSPLKNIVASNVMLSGSKRSPGKPGSSPFHNLFASPSPLKGFQTGTSPVTRQRKLILPSPTPKPGNVGDGFSDFLTSIKEEEDDDDLGVVPFQRSNSYGFVPQDELSASPPFAAYQNDGSAQGMNPYSTVNPGEVDPLSVPTPQWSPSKYNLRCSPARSQSLDSGIRLSPSKKSPTCLAQGRISVTKHVQLVNTLPPRDALRFVRDHFRKVLDKASADAIIEESKRSRKRKVELEDVKPDLQQLAMTQAVSRPAPSCSSGSHLKHRQSLSFNANARRRQEILPKPADWSNRREPCKIAPKKRKR